MRRLKLVGLIVSGVVLMTVAGPAARGALQPSGTPGAGPDPDDLAARVASLETRVAVLEGAADGDGAPGDPDQAAATADGTPLPGDEATAVAEATPAGALAGDALSMLPTGEPGVISIVALGGPVGSAVPLVVRNNTEAVAEIEVVGTARDAAGTLVASGNAQRVVPVAVAPGGYAIATVSFGATELAPDAALEFVVTAATADGTDLARSLEVVEAVVQPDAVVGVVRNGTGEAVSGVSVDAVCFDAGGVIRGYFFGPGAKSDLAPGEDTPFSATFFGTGTCERFLIGARASVAI